MQTERDGLLLSGAQEAEVKPYPQIPPARKPDPATRLHLLHEIFEAQADARPEGTAVVFGREKRTYAELEQRANRLAGHLRKRGVGRGSLVAMLLVVGAITALSRFVFHTELGIGPPLVALIIAATSLITMIVATVVAWSAVRVRPLDVLRYE